MREHSVGRHNHPQIDSIVMDDRSHQASKRSYPKSETARDRPSQQRPRKDTERPTEFKKDPIIFAGGLLVLVILITIVAVAASRANRGYSAKIVDGHFVETVTSCGPVRGFIEDGIFIFLGIPYAVPPVKERRWKQSQVARSLDDCWNSTFKALNKSSWCWQFSRSGEHSGTEDCLTLDIYTPKVSYMNPLPVIVYIGSETLNGGKHDHLRPTKDILKEREVIFVHVNFRLSVLGFLALDILTKNSYPPSSGNYGLSDIVSALKWIQLNIEHFGGDPRMVTLVGHQAGASLVTALSGSRRTLGLFRQIWVTGGSGYFLNRTLWEAEKQNEPLLLNTACDTYHCLLGLTPDRLLRSVPKKWKWFTLDLPIRGSLLHSWIVSDGEILFDSLLSVWEQHFHNDVPIVFGVNRHQNADLTLYNGINFTDRTSVIQHVTYRLGTYSQSLVESAFGAYPVYSDDPWRVFLSMLSDIRSVCPLLTLATEATRVFQSPVYFYVASQEREGPSGGKVADGLTDIEAMFGVYSPKTRQEEAFVDNMQKTFYDFIQYGIFNGGSDTMPLHLLNISSQIRVQQDYPNCKFWKRTALYPQAARLD